MALNILQWIFQSIPESLALTALALALSGQILQRRSVLLIGLPFAIFAYLVRLLPLTFGVHTIILVVILAILLNVQLRIKFSRCLLAALVTLIILGAAEIVLTSLVYKATGITFEKARQNILLWLVSGWPHIIFLLLLALIINRWRKTRGKKEEANA